VPEGRAKAALLRAIERTREFLPLRTVLRVFGLSPARYHAWRSSQETCSLDDRSSCPQTSPHQLTSNEFKTVRKMVTSDQYRHVPTGTLALLAQRLGEVFASPSTWYRLIRRFGWRRPRLRVHPAKPKIGLRTVQPNQAGHIDTTLIRLLDGSQAFLHAVIDNFSRRILAWRLGTSSILPTRSPSFWKRDGAPSAQMSLRPWWWRTLGWKTSTSMSTRSSNPECCAASSL